jgi:hypothetical protein
MAASWFGLTACGRMQRLRQTPRNFRIWHDPSVPANTRVGPEVGVELPVAGAGR